MKKIISLFSVLLVLVIVQVANVHYENQNTKIASKGPEHVILKTPV